jgi:glucose-1-phosphate adenylyltransferase
VNKITTLILAGGKGERLYPLTKDRAKPSVPFGGIYRIIDFTLSNAINSSLRKIYILIQYKSFSLQRHIREGWNIFSREIDEFIDVVPAQMRFNEEWYKGTADSVFQSIYFLNQEKPDLVLVLSGDHIYKMDYRKMIEFHKEKNADLTISVFEVPCSQANRFGVLKIDKDFRIIDFQEKPSQPEPSPLNPSVSFISMGVYCFNIEILVKRLFEDSKNPQSTHDFGKDIIPLIMKQDKVYGFPFIDENKKETKYWRDIGTLDAYYEANMDLVSVNPILNLYDKSWPIRTYQDQLPPAKTVFSEGDRTGFATDSIISPGCIISGAKMHHSILSPWVKLNSFSQVEDSIIFSDVQIGRYSKIKKTIIDKNVIIPPNTEIGYNHQEDKKRFTISENGVVVIPKNYVW